MSPPAPAKKKLHYAWIVAGVAFLTLLAAAGGRAAPGVMIVPLCNEFQWSRATVSSIISVNIFLFGMVGPFAAALYQRFGLRKMMVASMAMIAIGYGFSTHATQYWEFLVLWGVVVGLGSGLAATVLGAAVANQWFSERRGLVMGILTASTATGQLVFLPALAKAVSNPDRSWRAAPTLVAIAATGVIPIIWFLMRDKPADVGLRRFGEKGPVADESKAKGNPAVIALNVLAEVVRVPAFWFLSASFFICGASTNGLIGTHLVSAAYDCGIPEVSAAGLLAMMGICDLFGTTLSGWLSDRFNGRYLLFMYYGLRGLSLIYLPVALAHAGTGVSVGLTVFAVFYGLDWIATVPPTVKLTGDIFGPAKASIVFGWIVAAHQVGAAVAAFGAGYLRTTSGHYGPAFVAAGILCLVAAFGVLSIGRPRRDIGREPVLA